MSEIQSVADDALTLYLWHCIFAQITGDWSTCDECHYHFPGDSYNFAAVAANSGFSTRICPDILVAAVSWYVDYNMGYVGDDVNEYVINTIFDLDYQPGAESMPAYYITHYTDPTRHGDLIDQIASAPGMGWQNSDHYNDGKLFHGDCEDFATLRHALLRALGFDRNFIWHTWVPGHAFNIVLFKGAYRFMDYGSIHRYLFDFNYEAIQGAWNQVYGPSNSPDLRQFLIDHILWRVYPDRCGAFISTILSRQIHQQVDQFHLIL